MFHFYIHHKNYYELAAISWDALDKLIDKGYNIPDTLWIKDGKAEYIKCISASLYEEIKENC